MCSFLWWGFWNNFRCCLAPDAALHKLNDDLTSGFSLECGVGLELVDGMYWDVGVDAVDRLFSREFLAGHCTLSFTVSVLPFHPQLISDLGFRKYQSVRLRKMQVKNLRITARGNT